VTPALAILELSSIARGVIASDAIVKKAPVELMQSRPVSSGKHILVFGGEVASVEESFQAGKAVAGDALVDELYLPYASAQIAPLLGGSDQQRSRVNDSVAIIETTTVCSTVLAADAAAKAADVPKRFSR
jgi:microcompartment protein CcmL/EutN